MRAYPNLRPVDWARLARLSTEELRELAAHGRNYATRERARQFAAARSSSR